jgi:chemotaxis protein methyltransferase CheR
LWSVTLRPEISEQDIDLLLQAIYERYHYDFRQYAVASLKRRLLLTMARFECANLSQLQQRMLHDVTVFQRLLEYLTVQASLLFHDPEFFLTVRKQVVPLLATYPSIKLWVAGCGTGEEAYSFAILLAEEGLLERTRIYATDISDEGLSKAREGAYSLARVQHFTLSYRAAGGRGSLSDYYHVSHDRAVMMPALKQQITFADHSLASDSAFAEVQLVSCRNVLIYFARELQDRALGLFNDALCRRGYLCLGPKESVRFSIHAAYFQEWNAEQKIYRKID